MPNMKIKRKEAGSASCRVGGRVGKSQRQKRDLRVGGSGVRVGQSKGKRERRKEKLELGAVCLWNLKHWDSYGPLQVEHFIFRRVREIVFKGRCVKGRS
ncbi:hypothetical protein CCACVL1_19791 [Corchorus capsularis]|uniref:Uncharacterized protein n=1 Tax=Corchorus capsularis TaxID=210143 RepID=A0A1R3HEZ1_COCAP|nr:hypothetical protein CCACVL1_19791 [Corchorus capsularis]